MKKTLIFILACMLGQSALALEITHGPYICDMSATSVTIMWVTDEPGLSWVEYNKDCGQHFHAQSGQKVYDSRNGRRCLSDNVHKVKISGLAPNTKYQYRVLTQEILSWEGGDNISYGSIESTRVGDKSPRYFKTFPEQMEDLNFVVFSDVHEKNERITKPTEGIDFSKVDFVVLDGDMQNNVRSQEEIFANFLDTCIERFAQNTPVFMARGNHETRGRGAETYMQYFPYDGKFYYHRTIAGRDFLFLDGGEDKPDSDIEYSQTADYDNYRIEESEWLQSLVDNEIIGSRPIIVFNHIPFEADTWHGTLHLEQTILPVLNSTNVKAMISGHTHSMELRKANSRISFPTMINDSASCLYCRLSKDKLEIDVIYGKSDSRNKHFTVSIK